MLCNAKLSQSLAVGPEPPVNIQTHFEEEPDFLRRAILIVSWETDPSKAVGVASRPPVLFLNDGHANPSQPTN